MTRKRPHPMTRDEIAGQNARARVIRTLGYDPWERWENEKAAAAQRINDYWKEHCQ